MFWYLSFLRPPPTHASCSSGSVAITPQIANDLRTELYPDPIDILVSWSPCTLSGSASIPPTTNRIITTKPMKLTTWRPSSAYKELRVGLPPGLREGQTWRLVLSSSASLDHHRIKLGGNDFGILPFPVVSTPILFTNRKTAVAGKQEKIERLLIINTPKRIDGASAPELNILEQTSFDLDKKLWDSGIGMSAWLTDVASQEGNSVQDPAHPWIRPIKEALFKHTPYRVVELGAGTGIVSLVLSALRAGAYVSAPNEVDGTDHQSNQDSIFTTDLESAMPLLKHNINTNVEIFGYRASMHPVARILNWDEGLPTEIAQFVGLGLGAIIMADVTYNTASFTALVNTIAALSHSAIDGQKPLIIVGYKERDPEERTLWAMLSDIGISLHKIAQRDGAGGAPVEIWVGQQAA